MRNIIDYVEKKFETFDVDTVNEVDSLIFSEICYVRIETVIDELMSKYGTVRIKDLLMAEHLDKMLKNTVDSDLIRKLIYALAASPRFRDIEIKYHLTNNDVTIEKQFSATTFIINKNLAYVGFRGTDCTLVGWKEDFNMAFISPVPSQSEATKYLSDVGKSFEGELLVGGHSKGGNLAVYSSMKCDENVKSKIKKIYSHDGPGFRDEDINSSDFKSIEEKIDKTIPKSSIIGMILQNQEQHSIVKSSNHGIMQHAPFSWEVGENSFIHEKKLSNSARFTDEALGKWLDDLSDEKRKILVDTVFKIIFSTNSNSFEEISHNKIKSTMIMIDSIKNLDEDTKNATIEIFKLLYEYSLNVLKENVVGTIRKEN